MNLRTKLPPEFFSRLQKCLQKPQNINFRDINRIIIIIIIIMKEKSRQTRDNNE